jgi:ABC-type sugar transport system substrate-binding protein
LKQNSVAQYPTIDAFIGMNDEHVLALVETIDGANLHAIHKLALDARFIDDVGQMSSSLRKR